MTRLRLSDLPVEVRRRVEAGEGEPVKPAKRRPARETVDVAYRCADCDAVFGSYRGWERHADVSGHAVGWAELVGGAAEREET